MRSNNNNFFNQQPNPADPNDQDFMNALRDIIPAATNEQLAALLALTNRQINSPTNNQEDNQPTTVRSYGCEASKDYRNVNSG